MLEQQLVAIICPSYRDVTASLEPRFTLKHPPWQVRVLFALCEMHDFLLLGPRQKSKRQLANPPGLTQPLRHGVDRAAEACQLPWWGTMAYGARKGGAALWWVVATTGVRYLRRLDGSASHGRLFVGESSAVHCRQ